MRILIGIIAFVIWSIVSIQWYVCGVKGLCDDDKKELLNSAIVDEQITDSVEKVEETEPTPFVFTIKEKAIYFPFAKSKTKLTKNQEDSLKIIVHEVNEANAQLLLYGNTDNIGSDENNLKLGSERGEWVLSLMVSYGLSSEKIKVESKGESTPIEENRTESGRRKNRRVDIIVKNL